MSDLLNQPDAARLIFGLRDTGYSFNTAAADIIDNCLAANASTVNVEIELAPNGAKHVYFGDDGHGMDRDELFAAMRYGAPVRENKASLGKFGLGLKTASSSICLKFTVISRRSQTEQLNKLSWDLEYVAKIDAWEMLEEPVTTDESEVYEQLCGKTGTLVIWSKCDRMLAQEYEPGSTKEKQAVKRLAGKLEDHAALVYHRFLDHTNTVQNATLTINGEVVVGWNPFYPEKSEQVLAESEQNVEIEQLDKSIENATIKAWLLPHSKDITDDENKAFAKIANHRQGFYIYRENRLIHHGGWLGVFGNMDPHYSLLRIEFDFDHKLDDAFQVDVKKSRITLDPGLIEGLNTILHPIYREADLRYRRKQKASAAKRNVDHSSGNKTVDKVKNLKKPTVIVADPDSNSATISNNQGPKIILTGKVENNVSAADIHIQAVDDINSGDLWEHAFRSAEGSVYTTGVRINKHHDFYSKIYRRASNSGHTVEGMDLLLWALAQAEFNSTNPELEEVFEDFRAEVSFNLKKLLRDVPLPSDQELDEQ